MPKHASKRAFVTALASIGLASVATAAVAADVTAERLLNAGKDPQNWLMVHRDYDNSRHSPLTEITPANAKDLKLKNVVLTLDTEAALEKYQLSKAALTAVLYRSLRIRSSSNF